MTPEQQDRLEQMDAATRADIQRKAERRLRYRRRKSNSLWFGLGTMGIVGWSVAVPMVIGIALGLFLDERVPVGFSWTLTGMSVGIALGCLNAWVWISRKQEEIQRYRAQDGDTLTNPDAPDTPPYSTGDVSTGEDSTRKDRARQDKEKRTA